MGKLKQSIANNGGFKHWFVNVFWYHYRWPVLIGILILGTVIFITVDSLRKERYDTTVVIATDYFVDEADLAALDEVLSPVVPDIDGNGVVKIDYEVLFVGNTEVGRQNQERIYLYATEEDVSFYLMSQEISDGYTNPKLGYFVDSLADMGLPCDPANPARLDLSGNPVLKACGIEDIYLSIMDYTTDSGSSTAKKAKETAIAMAGALIEAGKTKES